MVEQVPFAVHAGDGMMVVAVHTEEAAFVGEELAHIGVGPQGTVRDHILDCAVCQLQAVAPGLEIGTVGIKVLVSDPVDAGVLKEPRHIQTDRITGQADHIFSETDDARGAGSIPFSFRHSAAEGKIAGTILIHHNGGIEEPGHVGTVFDAAGNQQAAPLIPPGTDRTVG